MGNRCAGRWVTRFATYRGNYFLIPFVELACHLFDAQRLTLAQATRMANMTRTQFEDELHLRGIAIYRLGMEEFQADMDALAKMKQES